MVPLELGAHAGLSRVAGEAEPAKWFRQPGRGSIRNRVYHETNLTSFGFLALPLDAQEITAETVDGETVH